MTDARRGLEVPHTLAGSLLLRAPVATDAESLAQNANHREVWINLRDRFPYPYSVEDAVRWLSSVENQNPQLTFAIDLDGRAVGCIGLTVGSDIERCSAEVGYWLGPEHWGHGIATAALSRICDYAFDDLGLYRVFAVPLLWNAASCRVLEKVGFRREGVMRNACIKDSRLTDMALYAKCRDRTA
jgi:[ribosomal protein S5]-alanine N-acetyltransferase